MPDTLPVIDPAAAPSPENAPVEPQVKHPTHITLPGGVKIGGAAVDEPFTPPPALLGADGNYPPPPPMVVPPPLPDSADADAEGRLPETAGIANMHIWSFLSWFYDRNAISLQGVIDLADEQRRSAMMAVVSQKIGAPGQLKIEEIIAAYEGAEAIRQQSAKREGKEYLPLPEMSEGDLVRLLETYAAEVAPPRPPEPPVRQPSPPSVFDGVDDPEVPDPWEPSEAVPAEQGQTMFNLDAPPPLAPPVKPVRKLTRTEKVVAGTVAAIALLGIGGFYAYKSGSKPKPPSAASASAKPSSQDTAPSAPPPSSAPASRPTTVVTQTPTAQETTSPAPEPAPVALPDKVKLTCRHEKIPKDCRFASAAVWTQFKDQGCTMVNAPLEPIALNCVNGSWATPYDREDADLNAETREGNIVITLEKKEK